MTTSKAFITGPRFTCLLIVVFLICFYIIDIPQIPVIYNNRILKSLIWIAVALLFYYKIPAARPKAKLSKRNLFYWWSFNFALIYIAASLAGGILDGFGRSPYDHSPKGILLNLLYIVPLLVSREFIRNYITNTILKKESYIFFVVYSLFMTIISFPINRFSSVKDHKSLIIFLAQFLAPEFSNNLLVTYMTFYGGYLPGIIYLGTLQAFHWLSPILPNLKWITTAFFGILCPVFSLIGIQNIYLKETRVLKRRDYKEDSILSWVFTCLVSILLIWFTVGVFPVYPSVIATGSMEPMIKPGDVILVKKIGNTDTLKVNDIIQFRQDSILISHRIIEIIEDQKYGIRYRTKGDNNPIPDSSLVKPEQIKGEVIYVVPKIGWPSLLIRSRNLPRLPETDF